MNSHLCFEKAKMLFITFIKPCFAVILSKSSILTCKRGSEGGHSLCSGKLVINLSAEANLDVGDEMLISSIEAASTDLKLASPIRLSVKKTSTMVRYTVSYIGDANSKPVERVGITNVLGCGTDPRKLDSDSTCGLMKSGNKPVDYSEGFCCSCSLDQVFGLANPPRGMETCNMFKVLTHGSSVHCLRWSDRWYSIFDINTPTTDYDLFIGINGQPLLTITPASPIAAFKSSSISGTVRLLGDLASPRPPKTWGGYYAATVNPHASSDWTDPRVKSAASEDPFSHGLLIPRHAVDLSGSSCNKIGVSHAAFVMQGERCGGRVGECLRNQLDDLMFANDTGLKSQLCAGLGRWVPDGHRLTCELTEQRHVSQVVLELDAVDLIVLTGDAPAKISQVWGARAAALAQKTRIGVEIVNVHDVLHGDYFVAVSNCTGGLFLAATAAPVSAPPASTGRVVLEIETKSIDVGEFQCTVDLRGAFEGGLMDSKNVTIEITEVEIDRWAQDGELAKEESWTDFTLSSGDECLACGMNLFCILGNLCLGKMFLYLGSSLGILALLYCILKKGALIVSCMKCVAGCKDSKETNSTGYKRNGSSQQVIIMPRGTRRPSINRYQV